ncbi:MAG: TetR/AcrR family transcriptional regulator [Akkermansiaceae bacterium]|nr:TetR/AcrR family transcriptional regulator [Akkermansiaceae bacterium]
MSTRQRLLDAARAEFGLRGIEGATTRAIAERAGCNEVTLFRLFESKLKLLGAVVCEASREFLALSDCTDDLTGDLTRDLIRMAAVCTASMEKCEDLARALIGESRRQPTLAKELIGDVMAPLHHRIADYLGEHQQAGRVLGELDTAAFAEILTATLMGGVLRRGAGLSAFDREVWITRTVEFLTRGILMAIPPPDTGK